MANYEELSVFKASIKLTESLQARLRKLPRDIKYTEVEKMKADAVDVGLLIYRANATRDKIPFIQEAIDKMTAIRFRLRLLHELHFLSVEKFAGLVKEASDVHDQLVKWRNYMQERQDKQE